MPTFEELRKNKYGDSKPQPEEELDESTVPVEERLPAPYEDSGDIMVNELLNQNPQLTTEQQESGEEFTSEQWFGLALGTSVELTAPIASNIAYLKWLKRAKTVARPLRMNPLGVVAAEVGIGVLSNIANQQIQLKYKSQKAFKISEVMAAGVFNASPVVKVIDGLPVFKFLQPKTGSKFAYRNIITKGGEKLVSGAAIGALESAFRQSVSGLLQEEELFDEAGNVREGVYRDLLVSAGVGATLNTAMHGGVGLFSYWRTKGRAGRAEAVKLTDLMDGDLVKQIDDINKEIQEEADGVGIFSALTTNFKEKNARIAALKKKKKQIEEAKELNQQLKEEIQEENVRVDEAEANPKPIEEEQTLTEEELDAPDENLREYTEEDLEVPKERQPVEEPEVKVEEEVVEEPTTPVEKVPEDIEPTTVKDEEVEIKEPEVVEEPKKPEAAPKPKVLKRDGELQSLIDRTKAAFSGGDVPTIEGANIIREGKKLYDNSISIFSKAIHTFREGGNKDFRALQIALDEVVFLRKLNQKVSDPLSTLVGRGLQSHRQDAAKYNYQTVLSERAGAENDAWSDVEKALRQTIENEADVNLFKSIQDALDVRPRFKRLGEELDKQATQDYKKKLRENIEKNPKEVAKTQAKQKAQLEKRLKELQKRFGDIDKIRPKDKPKKAEADAEIEELKNTIKFHEAVESEALKLEAALKERERLLEVETGPLGAQRAEITKPKEPSKVPGELEKVNEDINFLKKNIRSRVKGIDKAALEMTDEFQAAKVEGEINKELSKLDAELEELRAAFTKEPVEPGVKKPKQKDPRVKEKEDEIAFYKKARQEIITLKKRYAERARLLELETGPLGQQRAEVTPKPTGPVKSKGIIAELDKQIAFLRSSMRKRVDDIDRARLEMDEAFQEAKMLEAIRKRRAIAQKRLDERRERFGDDDDLDRRAAERAGRKIEETDPVLVKTQEEIKFYDEAEAEALKKKELKEELAKRAEMEGRGVMSEMRAHLAPKPTGPQKVRSTDKIKQEIRDSDKRMRDKLKDIDAAQDSFREERIYESVRKQAMLAAQRDVETKLSRFFKEWGNKRVYAMIHQTSSVIASALGGIASTFKQFVKLGTEPLSDLMSTKNYSGTQISALQVLKANAYGLREGLKNWKGTGRAVAMTAKNLESATGGAGMNRLTGDISLGDPVKLFEAALEQARRKRLRGEDIKGVQHIFARMPLGKMFNEFMKLPLRGIMPIDELFRRQLLRTELMAEAWKDAFDAIPNDPKKASELAADLYKQKWTKDQGLEILSQEGVNATATDTINKELLFDSNVANLDPSEIAQPISDKVLKFVKELKLLKDNPAIGTFIHLLAPIMTVVARGAGRSIRVGVPIIPAAQAARNPYNHRIKKVEGQIRDKNNYIAHEETTPQRRQELQKEKEELEQRIKELKGRRIAYHRDAITDTLMGSGMMLTGYGMGAAGVAVGTLAWMTPEQRKKFQHKNPKAKANTIEGWGYRELFPLSIGFAIGADYAMYSEMKEFTDEEGKPILTKDQSAIGFILRSITELFKEVPVAGGMKSVQKIMSGEKEQINSVLADWLGSFALMPSQINKVMKLYFEKGSVEELKGGDWQDRTAYRIVGHNPTGNKKTDHFGHDMQSPKTLLNTFIRWAPDRSQELNAFDEVYKKDIEGDGQLIKPPSQFPAISGIDMYKFVDNNGVSLHYRFNQEVKKLNIDKTIIEIVKNPKWRAAWQKGSRKRTGTIDIGSVSNPALQKLNTKFRLAYERAAKNMMKNKTLLNEFISEEENEVGTVEYDKYGKNKTLKQVIDLARGQSVSTGTPVAVGEVLGRNDLEELLESQRTD